MKRVWIVMAVVSLCLGVAGSAIAGEDLEVSFATYRVGHYVAPIDNKIVVGDRPFPFYVVVKNTGDRAAEIYEKKGAIAVAHLEFEFTDAKGIKAVVSHKKAPSTRERGGYRMMQPGEQQIASVLVNAEQWKMSVSIPSDKDSEWTLRVAYVNGGKRIYSQPYKVTIKAM